MAALAVALAALPLQGAACLDFLSDDERDACEAVCAKQDGCGLRSAAACLASLCDEDGFKVVDAGGDAHDLATLDANRCEEDAADCSEVALCVCPDACARVDECTGDPDTTCVNTCETLVEQDPEAAFQENRCKMESACADVPACS